MRAFRPPGGRCRHRRLRLSRSGQLPHAGRLHVCQLAGCDACYAPCRGGLGGQRRGQPEHDEPDKQAKADHITDHSDRQQSSRPTRPIAACNADHRITLAGRCLIGLGSMGEDMNLKGSKQLKLSNPATLNKNRKPISAFLAIMVTTVSWLLGRRDRRLWAHTAELFDASHNSKFKGLL